MLVSFALGDTNFLRRPCTFLFFVQISFALGSQRNPHFQWNIGCIGSLALGLCVGHVHFIFLCWFHLRWVVDANAVFSGIWALVFLLSFFMHLQWYPYSCPTYNFGEQTLSKCMSLTSQLNEYRTKYRANNLEAPPPFFLWDHLFPSQKVAP